jgi:hypothetical protein
MDGLILTQLGMDDSLPHKGLNFGYRIKYYGTFKDKKIEDKTGCSLEIIYIQLGVP